MNIENTCSIFIIFKIYQCAEILKKKCMHYENGIKDEKNIWKNLSLTWHNQGEAKGIIETGYEFGISEEEILARLQKKLNISLAEAQEYVKKFGRKSKSEDSDAEENG